MLIKSIWGLRDFPEGPVVKTLHPHGRGCRAIRVRELRSCVPCSMAKRKIERYLFDLIFICSYIK